MLADALEHLVSGIVDHPEDVEVTPRSMRRGQLLEVRVVDAIGRAVIAFLKKAHHSARLGIAHILQPALPQAAGDKGCAFSAVFIKFCFICRPRNGFRRIIGIL